MLGIGVLIPRTDSAFTDSAFVISLLLFDVEALYAKFELFLICYNRSGAGLPILRYVLGCDHAFSISFIINKQQRIMICHILIWNHLILLVFWSCVFILRNFLRWLSPWFNFRLLRYWWPSITGELLLLLVGLLQVLFSWAASEC